MGHAFITGGGQGIGAAIAAALRARGEAVTIVGRSLSPGPGVEVADVTDAAALIAAIARAELAQGPISILVNNAGAAESAPFARTDASLWARMLAVNLTAVYTACHALLPAMAGRGWGRVVNIASTAGLVGYPYVSAYTAAKHGVVGLTRALALEYARTGVTVNAICPGFTDTDLVARSAEAIAAKTGRTAAEAVASLVGANPQGRLVTPEEVAAAVLYLTGPGSEATNGVALPVAGGEVG